MPSKKCPAAGQSDVALKITKLQACFIHTVHSDIFNLRTLTLHVTTICTLFHFFASLRQKLQKSLNLQGHIIKHH